MAREYWIVDVANNLTKDRAEFWANRWGGQAIRVREVMEGESPTQPTGKVLRVLTDVAEFLESADLENGADCRVADGLLAQIREVQEDETDHAAALADALDGMVKLDEGNCQRYPGDEDVCMEVRLAREALAAYRASQKGGNHG